LSFTFIQEERLKSKIVIDQLFVEGSEETYVYPMKVKYIINQNKESLPQIGIIVPKRKFKKAVTRNLLKRRIREAYRLGNHEFKKSFHESHQSIDMMVMYMSSQIEDFHKIQKSMTRLLLNIQNKISNVE
jgi:ribonuclease P protein component